MYRRISEGRLGAYFYEYDASNKRVYQQKQSYSGSAWVTNATEFYFYGITGQKLGTYYATVNGLTLSWSAVSTQVFFRNRLVVAGASVQSDQLGSFGRYYPYGEDRNTPVTPNDTVKFASYTRDSVSSMDYANQRYFISAGGRFSTPDPYSATPTSPKSLSDPAGWNRFTYVGGDPINFVDRTGEIRCGGGTTEGPDGIIRVTVIECPDIPPAPIPGSRQMITRPWTSARRATA